MKSAKFEEEFVKSLIKQKEGERLDFKQKITSREKIAKTLAGFANTKGGYLVIGVSDTKKIIGIDPEEERFMIETANEEYCIPRVLLSSDEIRMLVEKAADQPELIEKSLLIVSIQKTKGPKILCKSKIGELKSYIRVNDQTVAESV